MAKHKIKIINKKLESVTGTSFMNIVEAVTLDGIKLEGLQSINMHASVADDGFPQIKVTLDFIADVEVVN